MLEGGGGGGGKEGCMDDPLYFESPGTNWKKSVEVILRQVLRLETSKRTIT